MHTSKKINKTKVIFFLASTHAKCKVYASKDEWPKAQLRLETLAYSS